MDPEGFGATPCAAAPRDRMALRVPTPSFVKNRGWFTSDSHSSAKSTTPFCLSFFRLYQMQDLEKPYFSKMYSTKLVAVAISSNPISAIITCSFLVLTRALIEFLIYALYIPRIRQHPN